RAGEGPWYHARGQVAQGASFARSQKAAAVAVAVRTVHQRRHESGRGAIEAAPRRLIRTIHICVH
ncbi:MAG: hypothetical protein ACLPXM_00475, partial [Terriglobales bacterium]